MSAGRLENIPDDANFVCCDVKSPLARDVVKNGHFDAIVHLAAQTMVPASMEDPKKDMEDNIEGTVNILEAARKYGVKRIIFSSSAAVYGDIAPECLPVKETEPLRPVSFYGLSKMTCENYIRLVLLSKSSKSLDHMLRKEYTVYCFEILWIGHMLRYHTDGFPESPTTVSLLLC